MKLTLLIANYNNGHFFNDCYRSICNQSFPDFDIIILDDCSTDDSIDLIKDLTKDNKRVKIYENFENKGVGYTKNKLIQLAETEICAFIDPDDALSEKAVEYVMMAYNKKPKISATYSKFFMCDENLSIIKTYPHSRKVDNTSKYFFNIHFEVSHFFTFSKEHYLKTEGMRNDLKVSEDLDMYLKLAEVGRFEFINEELYFYRIHNKGLSHDKSKEKEKADAWHEVLKSAAKRRGIEKIGGKSVNEISDFPSFIFRRENTILKKLLRRL